MLSLFQVPRAIQAGRVWVNQYNTYPAHAPLEGLNQGSVVKTIKWH
jgi:aldehyde dehydrogenase (NAD+)/aldehyde dehydrogenase